VIRGISVVPSRNPLRPRATGSAPASPYASTGLARVLIHSSLRSFASRRPRRRIVLNGCTIADVLRFLEEP